MALDKGETALAEVAKKKADQIESESIGIKHIKFTFSGNGVMVLLQKAG